MDKKNTVVIKVQQKTGIFSFYRFDKDVISIGSAIGNDINLPVKEKIHTVIVRKGVNYFVLNPLNQMKNTSFNGLPISIGTFKIDIINPYKRKKIKNFENTYRRIENVDLQNIDKKIKNGVWVGLFLTLFFLITLSLVQVPDELPYDKISNRFSRLIIDPKANLNIMARKDSFDEMEGEGVRSQGENGSRGDPKSKINTKVMRPIVSEKGVLGVLKNKSVNIKINRLLKAGIGYENQFSNALSTSNILSKKALYKGTFGSDLSGVKTGASGTSKDIVGGLSTKGVGGGYQNYGRGSIGSAMLTTIIPDDVKIIIKGSLERSEIEETVRRHLPQINHCYEAELKMNPDLDGKITPKFIIGRDGSVTLVNIIESTIGSSIVEQCVKNRISKWIFPEPRGGGMVSVNFPFYFRNIVHKKY